MSGVSSVSGDIKKKSKDTVPVTVSVPKESSSDIEKYIEKQIEIKLNSLLETLPAKVPNDLNIKPIYN